MFRYTRITATRPAILSKTFALDSNGQLTKSTSAALSEGQVETISIESLEEFSTKLLRLTPGQAHCYGITDPNGPGRIVTTAMLAKLNGDAIARSNVHFDWPSGGGILMIDYDPAEGRPVLDRNELVSRICAVVPGLANVTKLWWPSSSSHIFKGEEDLTGLRGQRLYILVDDATDIPRAGRVIEQHLWAAGEGFITVSKAGSLLKRSLVDGCVWQPCRLDFAAGAATESGLTQRRGQPIMIPGDLASCDSRTLLQEPSSDIIKAAERAEASARKANLELAHERRESWRKERQLHLRTASHGALLISERQLDRAVDCLELTRSFPLTVFSSDGVRTLVTVGDVLSAPDKYDGLRTLDPIEPDYRGEESSAVLYLKSSAPTLHSFARGGSTFQLLGRETIEVTPGRTADVTELSRQVMSDSLEFFDHGGSLAEVGAEGISCMDEHVLGLRLAKHIRFVKESNSRAKEPVYTEVDPPQKVLKQLISLGNDRRLPPLEAVIDQPILRADGSLMSTPGYDRKSGLLLRETGGIFPPISAHPSIDEVRKMLKVFWSPFNKFPFSNRESPTAILAGALTAILRPVLPTAPMIVIDAAVPGSGKTLLTSALGILRTGKGISLQPSPDERDDAETRKRLTASLIAGESVVAFDNCVGHLSSNALAAFLTSPSWIDRLLGQSRMSIALPNRAFVIINGRNLSLSEDLTRRCLYCKIDPASENPFLRHFDFNPCDLVTENRKVLVAAGLTLVKAALAARPAARGKLASFETWDRLVGRTVAWISEEVAPQHFVDPAKLIMAQNHASFDREELFETLRAIKAKFSDRWFSARDLHDAITDGDGRELLIALGEAPNSIKVPSTKSIGRFLLRTLDRPNSGLCLRSRIDGNKRAWRIQELETA